LRQKTFKNTGKIHVLFALIFAGSSLFLSSHVYASREHNSQLRTPISITANLNPFIFILGLPTAENGSFTAAGELQFHGSFLLVNNSITEAKGKESITLDGETYYSLFSFRYGLNDTWELGFKIPYIAHNSGHIDDFIKNWHNVFGLNNDRRDVFEDNGLHYKYSLSDQTDFELWENTMGWGDPLITAAINLSGNHPTRNTALRFSVKIPLGNPEKLTGNDASNLSVALAFDDVFQIFKKDIGLIGQGGYLYLEKGEILKELQRKHVAYGSLALNFPFTENIILKTQIDVQSSFYNSELLSLGTESFQYTLGGSIQVRSGVWLDFGIVENLQTDPTPDVAFYGIITLSI